MTQRVAERRTEGGSGARLPSARARCLLLWPREGGEAPGPWVSPDTGFPVKSGAEEGQMVGGAGPQGPQLIAHPPFSLKGFLSSGMPLRRGSFPASAST